MAINLQKNFYPHFSPQPAYTREEILSEKKKFSHEKCFFFLYSELKWKTKKDRNVEWHKFNNNNNSALSGASQYTAYRARHQKGVRWHSPTQYQIANFFMTFYTYVCTYLDMKNLIKFFILLLIFGTSLSLTVGKNSAWFRRMITEQFVFSVWRNFFHLFSV